MSLSSLASYLHTVCTGIQVCSVIRTIHLDNIAMGIFGLCQSCDGVTSVIKHCSVPVHSVQRQSTMLSDSVNSVLVWPVSFSSLAGCLHKLCSGTQDCTLIRTMHLENMAIVGSGNIDTVIVNSVVVWPYCSMRTFDQCHTNVHMHVKIMSRY